MQRHLFSYGILLLVLFLALGVWFYRKQSWQARAEGTKLFSVSKDLDSLCLQRGTERLSLVQHEGIWYEKQSNEIVSSTNLQTLFDYLQRIELRFPIEGHVPESLVCSLRDSGLCIEYYRHGEPESLVMGRNAEGELVLKFHEDYYLVRTVGFARSIVTDLSLSANAWLERGGKIRRPSDLQTIWLHWIRNPEQSFCIQIQDSLHASLYTLQQSQAIAYDTVRMSAFLYGFTQLELRSIEDTITLSTKERLKVRTPFLVLQFVRRNESDTLSYSLYRGEDIYDDPQLRLYGYVRDASTCVQISRLPSWDAILTTRQELAYTKPSTQQ